MKNITPWLDCIMDLPKIETLPKDIKKYLLKLWYDCKEKDIYIDRRGYGYQSYQIGGIEGMSMGSTLSVTTKYLITFRRYEKKPGDGFDEIPDESIMIQYVKADNWNGI